MQKRSNPMLSLAPTIIFGSALVAVQLTGLAKNAVWLSVLIVAAALAVITLTARSESNRSTLPDNLGEVFTTRGDGVGKAMLSAIGIVLIILMLYTGLIALMRMKEQTAAATFIKLLPTAVKSLLGVLAAVAFLIVVTQTNYSDGEPSSHGSVRFASIVLTVYPCYTLMLVFRENATNPYQSEFAWQLLTMGAFALMWIYMMGISAGRQYRRLVWTRISVRMTIVLSLSAMVGSSANGLLLEVLFCFVCAIVSDVMLSMNMVTNERRPIWTDDE